MFPIVVTVTDANGCTGHGRDLQADRSTARPSPSPTRPTPRGTVNAAFSETFTQTGAIGSATFTTASTLPTGLSLSTAGVLSGTPTQAGTFPIVVTVTDSNGCTGTGATYTLVIACQTITVTNPATTTGTAGAPSARPSPRRAAIGTITWSRDRQHAAPRHHARPRDRRPLRYDHADRHRSRSPSRSRTRTAAPARARPTP